MIVQIDAAQGADVNAVHQLLGNFRGDAVVHAVDTLHQQDIVRPHLQGMSLGAAGGDLKIELGHFHLFAAKQCFQAFGQKGHVQRVDGFQIGLSVFLQRQDGPIQIEVVQRDQPGLTA